MGAVISILSGIAALFGAVIPVYFKWRKLKKEQNEKVSVAPDSGLHTVASDRVHNRLEALQKGRNVSKEEQ